MLKQTCGYLTEYYDTNIMNTIPVKLKKKFLDEAKKGLVCKKGNNVLQGLIKLLTIK